MLHHATGNQHVLIIILTSQRVQPNAKLHPLAKPDHDSPNFLKGPIMKPLRTLNAVPEPERNEWLRRVKGTNGHTFTFYSITPFIVYVHWHCGRTVSCTMPLNECPGHKAGAPLKILTYIHGYHQEFQRDEFLELPQGVAHHLLAELGPNQLRGSRACFKRGNGKTAHVHFELLARHEKVSPSVKLPKPETPELRLRKLWGLNEAKVKLYDGTDLPDQQQA